MQKTIKNISVNTALRRISILPWIFFISYQNSPIGCNCSGVSVCTSIYNVWSCEKLLGTWSRQKMTPCHVLCDSLWQADHCSATQHWGVHALSAECHWSYSGALPFVNRGSGVFRDRLLLPSSQIPVPVMHGGVGVGCPTEWFLSAHIALFTLHV